MSMLDKMRAAFKKPENTGTDNSQWYPFFNMQIGEKAVIRFVPDVNKDNPYGFLVEKAMHTLEINGEKKKVVCPSTFGEECPICKLSAQYYKAGDKINGGKYWKKKSYIGQALVISDPLPPGEDGTNSEGKLKKVAVSSQIFQVIREAFESDDLETEPQAIQGGYDFTIKKTQQGDYATYVVGSKFSARARDLTDEEIEIVENEAVDLSTLLPQNPGIDKIEAMLQAHLSGGSVDEDDEDFEQQPKAQPKPATSSASKKPVASSSNDDEGDDTPAKPAAKPAAKPVAKPVAQSTDDDDDDADAILATIRARRKTT